MEAEFLPLVFLALFMVLAIALTMTAWNSAQGSRNSIAAKTSQYALGLAANLGLLWYTWQDGTDFVPQMGPISLQALILFFTLLLCVIHINEMQEIEEHAVDPT